MRVIGITGPSGAGKGEAARILKDKFGFSVIDADKVYHSLVSQPSDCLNEIVSSFGESVLDDKGGLDRTKLGRIVLGCENADKLERLNRITHKYVVDEMRKKVDSLASSDIECCVIDAPLLIEAGLCDDCDITVSVLGDKDERARRISLRDGISIEAALRRIASQKHDEFYIQNTQYAVYNNGDINSLLSSLIKILSEGRVI